VGGGGGDGACRVRNPSGSTAVRRSGRGRKRPIRQRGGAGFCASRVCDGILVEGPLAAAFRRGVPRRDGRGHRAGST